MNPLAIDLFCGLGGWTEGLLAEGYDVIGFDIERHQYGDHRYPAQLVIQDVLTLHGSQFKTADLIVASPPCQEYSYMAMPWSLAKAKAKAIREDQTGQMLADLNRLFHACFRIQKEASMAAGKHIPCVVENVRGAIPWVGRSRWNFGSFHLWGDVPALMPMTVSAQKFNPDGTAHPSWFAIADSNNRGVNSGIKVPTMGAGWYPPNHPKHVKGLGFNTHAERNLQQQSRRTAVGKGSRFTSRDCGLERAAIVTANALDNAAEGRKGYAKILGQSEISRQFGSKSPQRKMASAMIAKIPLPLSRHIAATFRPMGATR